MHLVCLSLKFLVKFCANVNGYGLTDCIIRAAPVRTDGESDPNIQGLIHLGLKLIRNLERIIGEFPLALCEVCVNVDRPELFIKKNLNKTLLLHWKTKFHHNHMQRKKCQFLTGFFTSKKVRSCLSAFISSVILRSHGSRFLVIS